MSNSGTYSIFTNVERIAIFAVNQIYSANKNLMSEFGKAGYEKSLADTLNTLSFLAEAAQQRDRTIFVDHIIWLSDPRDQVSILNSLLAQLVHSIRVVLEHEAMDRSDREFVYETLSYCSTMLERRFSPLRTGTNHENG